MDSLNASLEAEQKAKGEALRIKKKLEGDINELEIALDHANKVWIVNWSFIIMISILPVLIDKFRQILREWRQSRDIKVN